MAETDDSANRVQAHAIIQAVVQDVLDTDQPFQTTFRGRPPLRLPDGQELSGMLTPEILQHIISTVTTQVITALCLQIGEGDVEAEAVPDDTPLADADWNAKIDAVLADAHAWIARQEEDIL